MIKAPSNVNMPFTRSTSPPSTFFTPSIIMAILSLIASAALFKPKNLRTKDASFAPNSNRLPMSVSKRLSRPCLRPSIIPPSLYPFINPFTKENTPIITLIGKNIFPNILPSPLAFFAKSTKRLNCELPVIVVFTMLKNPATLPITNLTAFIAPLILRGPISLLKDLDTPVKKVLIFSSAPLIPVFLPNRLKKSPILVLILVPKSLNEVFIASPVLAKKPLKTFLSINLPTVLNVLPSDSKYP